MYKVKINDPRGGANFDPRAKILTTLLEVYQTMPYAKYLSSRPFDLYKKIFKFILIIPLVAMATNFCME
jgi:hypothetical protein